MDGDLIGGGRMMTTTKQRIYENSVLLSLHDLYVYAVAAADV